MAIVNIWHRTSYTYRCPVSLGPHRLLLRPRESRGLRIVSEDIAVTPPAPLQWTQDVFGNAIATIVFSTLSDTLVVESRIAVEHEFEPWPVFPIDSAAVSYPFTYSVADVIDLGALLTPQYLDPEGRLWKWAIGFVRGSPTDTLSLLKDINLAISAWISYEVRDAEGTQSPLVTLDRGLGSCRDIALLLIEAVRWLGFGARIVSGYLADRTPGTIGSADTGSTHAWAEIYLPGAGWITFDPTNRTMGDYSLIPVAVARDIAQTVPVSGNFVGATNDFLGMTVDVQVSVEPGE
jgi:transglutaminase-like putative cysteine protease